MELRVKRGGRKNEEEGGWNGSSLSSGNESGKYEEVEGEKEKKEKKKKKEKGDSIQFNSNSLP